MSVVGYHSGAYKKKIPAKVFGGAKKDVIEKGVIIKEVSEKIMFS